MWMVSPETVLHFERFFRVIKFLAVLLAFSQLVLWISVAILDISGLAANATQLRPLKSEFATANLIGSIAFYLIVISLSSLQLYAMYKEHLFVVVLFAIVYNLVFIAFVAEWCSIGSILFFIVSLVHYTYAFAIQKRSKMIIGHEDVGELGRSQESPEFSGIQP